MKKQSEVSFEVGSTSSGRSKLVTIGVFLVLLIAAGIGVVYLVSHPQLLNFAKSSQAKDSNRDLVTKVGTLIELPTGEVPTVATVADKEKLANQNFFAKAQNGDQVLIYPVAKKAILYRPSSDKIIEVASLNLEGTVAGASSPSGTPAETKKAKLTILNGTTTIGLAGVAEKKIVDGKVTGLESIIKGNAKGQYEKTLVVDIKGGFSAKAGELAKLLGGQVGTWPVGESQPAADVVVIVGNQASL